jgi:ParB family protein of integrating conjugative element (PFGI_1 class)
VIRFTLGRIKIGTGTTAVAPSDRPSAETAAITPEESSLSPAALSDGSVTVLRITDIQPYEKNPRHAANPLFDTIKASIRQRGMDAPLTVTRRPGATHYVVAAGGNTRLLAQLQIWQETTDPRFETVPVVIKAWRSESDVMAGHLIENEQRSDLTFWDKARGAVALKTEVEQERAAAFSLRQWESALSDLGLPIGKNVLSSYLFAVERLAPLGPAVATLSRNDVRGCLQPRFRTLGRLAQKFGLGETALYAHTLDPVMYRFAEIYRTTQTFAAADLAEEGDRALAHALQIALPELEAMLALLDQSPELTLTELRTRTAGATVEAPIRTELTTPRSREPNAGADPDPGTVSPGDSHDVPPRSDDGPTDAVPPGDSRGARTGPDHRSTGAVPPGDSRAACAASDHRSTGAVPPGDSLGLPVKPHPRPTDPVSRGDRRGLQDGPAPDLARHLAVSPGDSHDVPVRSEQGPTYAVPPGDSRVIDDPGDATPAPAAEPIDTFKLALLAFAQMTDCTDCLRWRDALPFNFYVEVPSAPLDLEPTSPQRHAGWWLLAFLSGQFDPGIAEVLPADSPWRRALGTEGDWSDDRLPLLVHTELGGPLAPEALVAWLTRTLDPAVESAWQCLQLARSAWRARSRPTSSSPSDAPATP